MLRLSELRGFIVSGSLYEKIYGKISVENHRENSFPSKLWGGAFWGVTVCAEGILHKDVESI